ncbi:MAG: hydrogenase expression/formation C-terminal domain-containing protein [Gammaproteobacteria bacterium]
MTRLTDIPIRIEGPALQGAALDAAGGLGGGVIAILAELATLLERFAEDHEPAVIDLRSLPMSPQDRAELQRALGRGEVQATVDADGLSTVRETGVAGIWWVEHRDGQGELTAESLEVTRIPDFLASAPDEIAAAGRTLRQIAGTTAARASLISTHAPARPHTP